MENGASPTHMLQQIGRSLHLSFFQKTTSKQINHSICLGQLLQTVKCSNKVQGRGVWADDEALPLLSIVTYINSYSDGILTG